MTFVWWLAAGGLLINVLIGLAYVTGRKGGVESMLAALLFGTAGVALALVLGQAVGEARAVDTALVFALLAAVLGVALARRGWTEDDGEADSNP